MSDDDTNQHGVCYMLTGGKHGTQLAVSLYSLRRHYDGPVALIAGNEEATEICQRLDEDPRSGRTTVICWTAPVGGGKGLQHANKVEIARLSPFDETVFLDCDTLVVGDFRDLWPRPGTEEIVLTQFADWKSDSRRIRKRTEPYRRIAPAQVARSQAHPYPAINTGTFGFSRRSTGYLKRWAELTRALPRFMCDELVAQIIFPDFPHRVLDERWNCSPIFSHPRYGPPRDHDVRIWHGHGWKFITRTHGRRIWWGTYQMALADNFAQMAGWSPGRDKRLARVLDEIRLGSDPGDRHDDEVDDEPAVEVLDGQS